MGNCHGSANSNKTASRYHVNEVDRITGKKRNPPRIGPDALLDPAPDSPTSIILFPCENNAHSLPIVATPMAKFMTKAPSPIREDDKCEEEDDDSDLDGDLLYACERSVGINVHRYPERRHSSTDAERGIRKNMHTVAERNSHEIRSGAMWEKRAENRRREISMRRFKKEFEEGGSRNGVIRRGEVKGEGELELGESNGLLIKEGDSSSSSSSSGYRKAMHADAPSHDSHYRELSLQKGDPKLALCQPRRVGRETDVSECKNEREQTCEQDYQEKQGRQEREEGQAQQEHEEEHEEQQKQGAQQEHQERQEEREEEKAQKKREKQREGEEKEGEYQHQYKGLKREQVCEYQKLTPSLKHECTQKCEEQQKIQEQQKECEEEAQEGVTEVKWEIAREKGQCDLTRVLSAGEWDNGTMRQGQEYEKKEEKKHQCYQQKAMHDRGDSEEDNARVKRAIRSEVNASENMESPNSQGERRYDEHEKSCLKHRKACRHGLKPDGEQEGEESTCEVEQERGSGGERNLEHQLELPQKRENCTLQCEHKHHERRSEKDNEAKIKEVKRKEESKISRECETHNDNGREQGEKRNNHHTDPCLTQRKMCDNHGLMPYGGHNHKHAGCSQHHNHDHGRRQSENTTPQATDLPLLEHALLFIRTALLQPKKYKKKTKEKHKENNSMLQKQQNICRKQQQQQQQQQHVCSHKGQSRRRLPNSMISHTRPRHVPKDPLSTTALFPSIGAPAPDSPSLHHGARHQQNSPSLHHGARHQQNSPSLRHGARHQQNSPSLHVITRYENEDMWYNGTSSHTSFYPQQCGKKGHNNILPGASSSSSTSERKKPPVKSTFLPPPRRGLALASIKTRRSSFRMIPDASYEAATSAGDNNFKPIQSMSSSTTITSAAMTINGNTTNINAAHLHPSRRLIGESSHSSIFSSPSIHIPTPAELESEDQILGLSNVVVADKQHHGSLTRETSPRSMICDAQQSSSTSAALPVEERFNIFATTRCIEECIKVFQSLKKTMVEEGREKKYAGAYKNMQEHEEEEEEEEQGWFFSALSSVKGLYENSAYKEICCNLLKLIQVDPRLCRRAPTAVVVGAGIAGLRMAIRLAMCGVKVSVVEKSRSFTRINRVMCDEEVWDDLTALSAETLDPYWDPCMSFRHVSIAQVQCLLLRNALLLGVEVLVGTKVVHATMQTTKVVHATTTTRPSENHNHTHTTTMHSHEATSGQKKNVGKKKKKEKVASASTIPQKVKKTESIKNNRNAPASNAPTCTVECETENGNRQVLTAHLFVLADGCGVGVARDLTRCLKESSHTRRRLSNNSLKKSHRALSCRPCFVICGHFAVTPLTAIGPRGFVYGARNMEERAVAQADMITCYRSTDSNFVSCQLSMDQLIEQGIYERGKIDYGAVRQFLVAVAEDLDVAPADLLCPPTLVNVTQNKRFSRTFGCVDGKLPVLAVGDALNTTTWSKGASLNNAFNSTLEAMEALRAWAYESTQYI